MPSTRSSSSKQAAVAAGSVSAPLSSSSTTTSGTYQTGADNSRRSGLRKRPTTTAAGATAIGTTGGQAAGSTALGGQHDKNTTAENKSGLNDSSDDNDKDTIDMSFTQRNRWMVFAVASGACAAFNGVFAKLTTNDLTTTIAKAISSIFNLSAGEGYVEVVVRVIFFSLNLVFNGVMWTLFTQALAKGSSTTQVAIMNTSTNFMITAILGFVVFSESLPPLWWLGAAMLVAGNVIIGRKDGEEEETQGQSTDPVEGEYRDDEDEDVATGGSGGGLFVDGDLESGSSSPPRKDVEDEDVPLIGEL